ncbi:hypothetical protein EJ05DRAFT_474315 [Pseudovirgaria hyperparasitica]|uniref:Late endosomal/lysosomal adaptor and MAPK and MTOR activator-domain-containing protein n=1 Tax=Pseudovirgaria hyperparasitica TaxID=470096 RepID=A0A6A6WC75_9PEZI|nr:uncharacterized protein EJ05DRAFT_474315 [Pseudovirgaria hyperparasitica]KAF2760442.1 hypothetical protein EJ05DRAFT_474315 [Pseudovirgaria hyperparasitica]
MGICASCLGLNRHESTSDPSDTSQLLNDHYQPGYGSINHNPQLNGHQPDPEEIRRQRDALERICAQTSDKLIDVSQPDHPDMPSKMAPDYPRLFAELFPSRRRKKEGGTASSHGSDEAAQQQELEALITESLNGDGGQEGVPWYHVVPPQFGPISRNPMVVLGGVGNGKDKV